MRLFFFNVYIINHNGMVNTYKTTNKQKEFHFGTSIKTEKRNCNAIEDCGGNATQRFTRQITVRNVDDIGMGEGIPNVTNSGGLSVSHR